jgi:hypothetical protein
VLVACSVEVSVERTVETVDVKASDDAVVISAFVVPLDESVDWRADVTAGVVVSGCVEDCSVVAPSAEDGGDDVEVDGASDDSEAPAVVCVSTVVVGI